MENIWPGNRLTLRESLRDIEFCLASKQAKLYHMGLGFVPARSKLSDALNQRDWRIYHDLAMRLIIRARDLYATEPTDLELDATVKVLDILPIEAGAFYVMDRGYLNFGRLFKMHQAGALIRDTAI